MRYYGKVFIVLTCMFPLLNGDQRLRLSGMNPSHNSNVAWKSTQTNKINDHWSIVQKNKQTNKQTTHCQLYYNMEVFYHIQVEIHYLCLYQEEALCGEHCLYLVFNPILRTSCQKMERWGVNLFKTCFKKYFMCLSFSFFAIS